MTFPLPRGSNPNFELRGSILMLSLWAICLLSSFAVILSYQVRQKLTLVKRLEERDKARFIADAAVKKAAAELKKEPQKSYACLQDKWSSNPQVFKEDYLGADRFSIYYDYLEEKTGQLQSQYGLIDEERKINLNKAQAQVIERLLKIGLGLGEMEAQELAASIKDWVDSDSQLSIPFGSAEDSDYRSLRYPYEAKDSDMESLDELLLVKGMTPEIFDKIQDYLTVYGDGRVNVNTASKIVLLALGLNERITDAVISLRFPKDKQEAQVFTTPQEIVPKVNQICPLSEAEAAFLNAIAENSLATVSNNFTVRAGIWLKGRNKFEVTSVINRAGNILYWKEP